MSERPSLAEQWTPEQRVRALIICSAPGCQTTAGCVCSRVSRPAFKSLSDFTDEEIAREYYWRAQKKLGDPRVGVGLHVRDEP